VGEGQQEKEPLFPHLVNLSALSLRGFRGSMREFFGEFLFWNRSHYRGHPQHRRCGHRPGERFDRGGIPRGAPMTVLFHPEFSKDIRRFADGYAKISPTG
jgi:hypothetical protein